jgi:hypothetical protein
MILVEQQLHKLLRHVRPLLVVGSTGERNTLVFSQRWSVGDEAAKSDLLFCSSAVRDLGSVAGWRVDEVDRATV